MKIAIAYHSGFGHTKLVAERIANSIRDEGPHALLYDVTSPKTDLVQLSDADTIVFGSPTYFGNVYAEFKTFMELTANIWYHQRWKDKFAAGFTNSSTRNGDKFNTLIGLLTFAAQHSMIWIPLGILPQHDEAGRQKQERNGMASYIGLMTMATNSHTDFLPPEDLMTADLFGKRLAAITIQNRKLQTTSTIE